MSIDLPVTAIEAILDRLTEGIILTDDNGQIVYLNAAARRLHGGMEPGVSIHTFTDQCSLLDAPDGADPVLPLDLTKAIVSGDTVDDTLWCIRQFDGTEVIARGSARPIDKGVGAPSGTIVLVRNVTRQHTVEQDLRQSESRYHLLLESLPNIVYSSLPDGTPDYLNQPWYTYTGAPPGEDTYATWHTVLHPDDRERATMAWSNSLQTGKPLEVEYRLRGADGQYQWFLARGIPQRDADGSIARWFGTATNIHRQKREEEKQRFLARLSEETRGMVTAEEVTWTAMRLLGEHLQAARSTYNEVDESNDLVTAARDYCREGESILGTFPLSAFGTALLDDLRAGRTAIIRDASTDPRTAGSYETMYRNIGIRSFIAAPLIKDGVLVTILSVNMVDVRDWTVDEAVIVEEVAERTWLAVENARLYQVAQREAQERQRAEEHSRRLAAIVESSLDAIVSKDMDGIVTSWNAAAERIYGYTAAEIIGRSKSIVIPEDRADELRMILERVRRGESLKHYDTVRRRKDGTLVEVSVSVSALTDSEGTIVGAATIARDITDRVRAEKERTRHMSEIEALYERLQRAMRETHHRVRNSLQIISALIDLELPDSEVAGATEPFRRIGGHVRALAAVHDLLTEQAKRDSVATDISAREIVLALIDLVGQTSASRRIVAEADDARLSSQQGASLAVVAHELISNAVKYGHESIEVRLTVADSTATLQVSDDGPGFEQSFNPAGDGNTGLELVTQVARWDLRAEEMRFDTRPEGAAG